MSTVHRRIAIALLGFLALSCASSKELARRSEVSLGKQDYERAYKQASASLGKDPHNVRAAEALSVAAAHLVAERQQRILNLASVDTIAAADLCVDLVEFRSQAVRDGATLEPDSAFALDARRIRRGAAAHFYASGVANTKDHPKQAYREMTAVQRYVPGYRDVDTRLPKLWDRAVTPVAVLPFNDETGVAGLSHDLTDHLYDELAPRVRSKMLEFTQLIPPATVYDAVTVSQLGDLSRAEAIEIGRHIGARRVVYGRVRGLNTHSDTDRYHGTVWRKYTERDTSGAKVDRYADIPFDAIQRWRDVKLRVEFEVIDVETAEPLVSKGRDLETTARTVYTSFVPDGDCQSYCLTPPAMKAKDPDRCERLQQEWANTFRSWSVPRLLERSRRDHARTHYKSEYRHDFIGYDADYPVFMDDCPSTDELVQIALDDSWSGILDALKELDPQD